MVKKCGFTEEATFGTSPLAAPAADTVYYWGVMNYGWQMPWHEEPTETTHNLGEMYPAGVVRGENKLEFSLKYDPVHALQWYYGGLNSITDGGGGVYTFTRSNTVDLKSRTGYFEHDDTIIEAQGLKVVDLDMFLELGEALYFEEKLRGTSAKVGTKITTETNPIWPSSLNQTSEIGQQYIAGLTHNSQNQYAQRLHVGLHNFIKRGSSMMSGGAINYNPLSLRRDLMAVVVDFNCPFIDSATSFDTYFRTEVRDKPFYLDLTWNTSYYWHITIPKVRFTKSIITVPAADAEGEDTVYVISGVGFDTGMSVVVKDGHAYA